VLFAKTADQGLLFIKLLGSDFSSIGTFDYNNYCRPLDKEGYFIHTHYNTSSTNNVQVLDLAGWKQIYKKDLNGKVSTARIQPHKINSLIGSNKYSNGTFNSSISGINVSAPVTYTKTWLSSKLDAGTLQGKLSSTKASVLTGSIPVGSVTSGKKYVVKFTAQSSKDTSMSVFMRKSGSPYTVLSNNGVKSVAKITAGRKDYEYVFTAKNSESTAVLMFELNGRSHTYWLDNIKVYEADAVLTNPDNNIRFVYNASSATKSIALSGGYVDASGKTFSSSISLAPYASAVLVKSTTTSSLASTELLNQSPTVSLTSPTASAVYTASADVQLSATAADADDEVSKVEFYNGSTLLNAQSTAPYDWTWTGVAAGTYTITAKAYDNSGNVTTSAPVSITVRAASLAMAMPSENDLAMSAETTATMSLYPNPATSSIYVQLSGMVSNQPAKLTIYNLAGSTVKTMPVTLSGSNIKVDITSLAPGTYILTLAGEGFNKTQKFLKIEN
jgi:hypothetical protein